VSGNKKYRRKAIATDFIEYDETSKKPRTLWRKHFVRGFNYLGSLIFKAIPVLINLRDADDQGKFGVISEP